MTVATSSQDRGHVRADEKRADEEAMHHARDMAARAIRRLKGPYGSAAA